MLGLFFLVWSHQKMVTEGMVGPDLGPDMGENLFHLVV